MKTPPKLDKGQAVLLVIILVLVGGPVLAAWLKLMIVLVRWAIGG